MDCGSQGQPWWGGGLGGALTAAVWWGYQLLLPPIEFCGATHERDTTSVRCADESVHDLTPLAELEDLVEVDLDDALALARLLAAERAAL